MTSRRAQTQHSTALLAVNAEGDVDPGLPPRQVPAVRDAHGRREACDKGARLSGGSRSSWGLPFRLPATLRSPNSRQHSGGSKRSKPQPADTSAGEPTPSNPPATATITLPADRQHRPAQQGSRSTSHAPIERSGLVTSIVASGIRESMMLFAVRRGTSRCANTHRLC